ncbi:hypothetical protein COU49_02745 [Candidatus Nomurabacteria bacterium CG10_big_fil_rev_8_21_14_0_10_35_16]|uniref:Nudix hydrolase domain-containing protein n=1 Tax=Candidatus Nomurabacteria bacterium CG10_big_fil_rev_8_21_14_0_10_35_16 TaxID=1974731 RepID=A0A2H0TAP0_9BACT|nr:MAG: hypothetical protein COU49_02745 [Candidatus Nomurabacteria bacterium CG10_big_fil_rev_8_21_14_0_10_35_16]
MDLIDVVNEQDEVISSNARKKIHKLGLLHREIHVWFFDENKNIFFQKRGLLKNSPGLLDASVGGHVDSGEFYEEAAVREIKEEVGIKITQQDLFLLKKFKGFYQHNNKKNNFIRSIFIYKIPVTELKAQESSDKNGGFEKISLKDLSKIIKTTNFKFLKFILEDEIPIVLDYLNSN